MVGGGNNLDELYIREKLKNTNIFLENEYFEKYIELMVKNQSTKQQPFKTQLHHIVPKFYFKRCGIEIDESSLNVVNLLYADHVIAHYYLAMCCINGEDKYSNLSGVRRIFGKINCTPKIKDLIENFDEIQKYYEDTKHQVYDLYKMSDETKKKISDSITGRISIRSPDNLHQKYIYENQLQEYLEKGWFIGHNLQTEESKKKISQKISGRIKIYKNDNEKQVLPSEIDAYILDGWNYGRLPKNSYKTIKGRKAIHKDGKIKYVYQEEILNYIDSGWELGNGMKPSGALGKKWSDERRKNNVSGIKGKIPINKEGIIKYINPEEVDTFLSLGWSKGTNRHNRNVLGKIWINNGKVSKYSSKDELDAYLNNGWVKGRIKNKKGVVVSYEEDSENQST